MRRVVLDLSIFNQLSEETREKLIEIYADVITNCLYKEFSCILRNKGYLAEDIFWDLNYYPTNFVGFRGFTDVKKISERLLPDEYRLLLLTLYAHGLTIDGAISVYVNYTKYSGLVNAYITIPELLFYRDTWSNKELNFLTEFQHKIEAATQNDVMRVISKLKVIGYEIIERYASDEVLARSVVAHLLDGGC